MGKNWIHFRKNWSNTARLHPCKKLWREVRLVSTQAMAGGLLWTPGKMFLLVGCIGLMGILWPWCWRAAPKEGQAGEIMPVRRVQTFSHQLAAHPLAVKHSRRYHHLTPPRPRRVGLKSSLQLYWQFKREIDEHQSLMERVLQKGEILPVWKDVRRIVRPIWSWRTTQIPQGLFLSLSRACWRAAPSSLTLLPHWPKELLLWRDLTAQHLLRQWRKLSAKTWLVGKKTFRKLLQEPLNTEFEGET